VDGIMTLQAAGGNIMTVMSSTMHEAGALVMAACCRTRNAWPLFLELLLKQCSSCSCQLLAHVAGWDQLAARAARSILFHSHTGRQRRLSQEARITAVQGVQRLVTAC
jgi:hypothetical protein